MRPLMPPVSSPDNLFHDGDPSTGDLGTIVPAEHLNNEQASIRDIQSELISILTTANLTPNPNQLQLLLALEALFAAKSDTLGALASLVGAANKLPYFTGSDAAALTDLTAVGRNVIGQPSVANLLSYLGLKEAAPGVAVVGDSRNARMSIAAASATGAFTADSLIVAESLSGKLYRLANVNKTINLATTGAGGMDTGTAPVSGFVGLYVIYNPTTGDTAMLAVNATSAAVPEIYGGANLPAGYTASALVAVWPVASNQLTPAFLCGRNLEFPVVSVVNSSSVPTAATPVSLATAVPFNAKDVRLSVRFISSTGTGAVGYDIGADLQGIGRSASGGYVTGGVSIEFPPFIINLITRQQCYHRVVISGATTYTYVLYASGYSI